MSLAIAIVAVIIGLAVLVWSADTFIDGATNLAVKLNMPSFLIGVIILGVGTSAPEMVVSALSALDGSPGIALGNAFGSNIMNIALVLGMAAIISPIAIKANVIKQDMMFLIAATALVAFQLSDGKLTLTEGIIMLVALAIVLFAQIVLSLKGRQSDDIPHENEGINTRKAIFSLIVGLVLLVLSSRVIVFGAVELAKLWGLSELLIGLTIVAIGTSLPELVASIVAARRGESDMALGNIVGSNLFNTLGVVGLAAIISPMNVEASILNRDMLMVGIMTTMLFILSLVALRQKSSLYRMAGIILLTTFVIYTFWLIQTATV